MSSGRKIWSSQNSEAFEKDSMHGHWINRGFPCCNLMFILLCMIVDSEKWKYGLVFLYYSWFGVVHDYWVVPNLKLWPWIVLYNSWVFSKTLSLMLLYPYLSLLLKLYLIFLKEKRELMLWYFVVVWLRELRHHSFLVWFLIVKYKRDSQLLNSMLWFFFCSLNNGSA